MSRRVSSLHHNHLPDDGKNIPFHREHRSKKGRESYHMQKKSSRFKRNWKLKKIEKYDNLELIKEIKQIL